MQDQNLEQEVCNITEQDYIFHLVGVTSFSRQEKRELFLVITVYHLKV